MIQELQSIPDGYTFVRSVGVWSVYSDHGNPNPELVFDGPKTLLVEADGSEDWDDLDGMVGVLLRQVEQHMA